MPLSSPQVDLQAASTCQVKETDCNQSTLGIKFKLFRGNHINASLEVEVGEILQEEDAATLQANGAVVQQAEGAVVQQAEGAAVQQAEGAEGLKTAGVVAQ